MSRPETEAQLIQQSKLERGYVKGKLTRKRRDMKELMLDKSNLSVVEAQLKTFECIIPEFQSVHMRYHELLQNPGDIQISNEYRHDVMKDIDVCMVETNQWCHVISQLLQAEKSLTEQVPKLEIDHTTSSIHDVSGAKRADIDTIRSMRSRHTSSSKSSSVTSAKVKLAAKRASLMAEAAALQQRQDLEKHELALHQRRLKYQQEFEEEQLDLRQKKRQLDVNVELAKAEAEERAYSNFGQSVKTDSVVSVNDLPDSATVLDTDKLDYVRSWRADVEKHTPTYTPNMPQTNTVTVHADVHHESSPVVNPVTHRQPHVLISNNNREVNLIHEKETPALPHVSSPLNPNAVEWSPPSIGGSTANEQMLTFMQESQKQQMQLINSLQLPKAKLLDFYGNPLEYWTFINSFQNNVDCLCVDAKAKLVRLLEYCKGKAGKVIQHCASMDPDAGYLRALELLKQRFGNEFVIAETWISKVTDGGNIKASDREGLQDFADELVNCSEMLNAMNRLSELNNQRTLVMIVQRLPVHLQNRWKREAYNISKRSGKTNIQDVVNFVVNVAAEANDPVCGRLTEVQGVKAHSARDKSIKKRNSDKHRFTSFNVKCDENVTEPTRIDQQPSKVHDPHTVICQLCERPHSLLGCTDFKKLSPPERLRLVINNRLCVNCLRPGHYANRCGRYSVCTVSGCGKKHSTFLHQTKFNSDLVKGKNTTSATESTTAKGINQDVTCTRTGAGNSKVALPIVPVKVYNPINKKCVSGQWIYKYVLCNRP